MGSTKSYMINIQYSTGNICSLVRYMAIYSTVLYRLHFTGFNYPSPLAEKRHLYVVVFYVKYCISVVDPRGGHEGECVSLAEDLIFSTTPYACCEMCDEVDRLMNLRKKLRYKSCYYDQILFYHYQQVVFWSCFWYMDMKIIN